MRAPWMTVAAREVRVKLTDRAFLVSTSLMIGVLLAFIVVQGVLSGRTQTFDVAVTSAAQPMGDALVSSGPSIDDKVRVRLRPVGDDAAARTAVSDGEADAWLAETADGWRITSKNEVDDRLQRVVESVVRTEALTRNARASGTTLQELTRGTEVSTAVLEGDVEERNFATGMGFIFASLFYIASVMFGMTLAGSVVEEKQSRIVEIMATKIPLRHLLAGKIAGNTLIALLQMTLYVAIGVVGLQFTDYASFLSGVSGGIVWFLVFFVVGFLLLACLWAVAGALASRSEDLQATSTPLTMLLIVVFFASLMVSGVWMTVGSFVPPFSAIIMPMRVVRGDAAWWEPVAAIGILALSAALIVVLAERIYRRSLLQTQGRLSLGEAWKARE